MAASQDAREIVAVCDLAGEESHTLTVPITDGSVREGVLQLKVQLMAAVNAHMQAKNAADAGDEVDLMEEAVEDEGPGSSSAAGKAGRQKKRKQGGTKPAV